MTKELYIIILVCIAAPIVLKLLNKIAQRHSSPEDALHTYEGKLLICGYIDENLSPQEIFDTSQLDDKGLMAIIYVNKEIDEPILYEDAIVGVDDSGICGVIVLS